jgi:endonuclease YncB( thermonuclease family)
MVAGLSVLAVLLILSPAFAAPADCLSGASERVEITAVSDRLDFMLSDGRQVRLVGLDLPDPGRGDPATATAARAFATGWLAGRAVEMRAVSGKPDRWGRLRADFFSAPPEGAPAAPPIAPALSPAAPAPAAVSVSLFLLSAGFARVWPEPEALSCALERLAAERAAREKRLGLWRDPYYGVVEAADLDELRKRDGQFTLIEGTPSRVAEGRSRYFVDFGLHRGFTIVIPKRRAAAFERSGMTISALAGAKIVVRGALDDRFALRMEISEPSDIERLDKGDR